MTDPASIKKSLSAQFSTSFVDVPAPLEQTDPEALAQWLQLSDEERSSLPWTMTVVDVRLPDEFATGNISGSLNCPHDGESENGKGVLQLLKPTILAAAASKRVVRVVFASLQSPDIDDAVAQEFVRAVEESVDELNGATVEVSLLLGGVLHWLRNFRDGNLTLQYAPHVWDGVLSS